jgi:hypothetical protein
MLQLPAVRSKKMVDWMQRTATVRVPSISWLSRLMVKTAQFAQACAGLWIILFVCAEVLPRRGSQKRNECLSG